MSILQRIADIEKELGRTQRNKATERSIGVLRAKLSKLRSELRAGRTLAQVAKATPGKSASGLVAAIVADTKARLPASVAAGGLTPAREKLLLANLQQRVAAEGNAGKPGSQVRPPAAPDVPSQTSARRRRAGRAARAPGRSRRRSSRA